LDKKLMLPTHLCMTHHVALYHKRTNKQTKFTYNVTLKCLHATTVRVEMQVLNIVIVCVCCFRYPTCSVHAPYCRMWPVWFYIILHFIS
jgi:hypothetical protein